MLRADKHGLVKIFVPERSESFELHGGSYVIRCQTGYTSRYMVHEVLQSGTVGKNSCGNFGKEKAQPGEAVFYSHKLNWFQSLFI